LSEPERDRMVAAAPFVDAGKQAPMSSPRSTVQNRAQYWL
jgi:hypothetical protein